ncbi:hypothetical protein [Desulfosarcina sp.]|uniref:hypothetical protein n=1 Tax=Desulfosarcina sp. TaxID=2027861 RepID=UPI003561695F
MNQLQDELRNDLVNYLLMCIEQQSYPQFLAGVKRNLHVNEIPAVSFLIIFNDSIGRPVISFGQEFFIVGVFERIFSSVSQIFSQAFFYVFYIAGEKTVHVTIDRRFRVCLGDGRFHTQQ